jgi:hypothetical protein
MAVGDLTVTSLGVFKDTTIAAGMAGQNSGAATAGADTTDFRFIPFENGQVLVLKIVRAAA